MRTIGIQGLALIKNFEGFSEVPYQDKKGIWTIGYGHIKGVTAYDPLITKIQANMLLYIDLYEAESQVESSIHVELNNSQYDALVSLVYNTGTAPLNKTLGQLLNAGNYDGAAKEFLKWIYVDGEISAGLVRRRAAEKALFLSETASSSKTDSNHKKD